MINTFYIYLLLGILINIKRIYAYNLKYSHITYPVKNVLSLGAFRLLNRPPQTYVSTSLPLQSGLCSYLVRVLLEKPLFIFSNPPKAHVFSSSPIRSSISLTSILKKITLSKVFSATITIILMATLRYIYFGGLIANPLNVTESIC